MDAAPACAVRRSYSHTRYRVHEWWGAIDRYPCLTALLRLVVSNGIHIHFRIVRWRHSFPFLVQLYYGALMIWRPQQNVQTFRTKAGGKSADCALNKFTRHVSGFSEKWGVWNHPDRVRLQTLLRFVAAEHKEADIVTASAAAGPDQSTSLLCTSHHWLTG